MDPEAAIAALRASYITECETRLEIEQWSSARWGASVHDQIAALIPADRHAGHDARIRAVLSDPAIATFTSLAAAVLAAMAERYIALHEFRLATDCAEEAVVQNNFDLHAQDVLILARGMLRDGQDDLAATRQWLATRHCAMPFEAIETTLMDTFTMCCPMWLPVAVGNFSDSGIEAVLQSGPAHAVRDSIRDGSFRYCSKLYCAKIAARDLPPRLPNVPDGIALPKNVVFSHDPSCNLSCPSCRKGVVIVPKSQQERFDSVSDRFFVPLMRGADEVKVCGSGDPFASTHFRNLLQTYCRDAPKRRKIVIHTNGVLCDERSWLRLGLDGHVSKVMVSLDAADPETYAYTRRGGDYDRVLANLAFLSALRQRGGIDALEMLFVVQARNFREMPAFVRLARSFRADAVLFQTLANWGTYDTDEYQRHNVFAVDHADHPGFLDVLHEPELLDPIVDLGNLATFMRSVAFYAPALQPDPTDDLSDGGLALVARGRRLPGQDQAQQQADHADRQHASGPQGDEPEQAPGQW